MAHPKGLFQAVTAQADNGNSPEFYIREPDQMQGGLQRLAPGSIAASGGFASGTATLQFYLCGTWHNSTLAFTSAGFLNINDFLNAPTASKYRWAFTGIVAAGADVTIQMATPFELTFESQRGLPAPPAL